MPVVINEEKQEHPLTPLKVNLEKGRKGWTFEKNQNTFVSNNGKQHIVVL